jgi:hypothetical protein
MTYESIVLFFCKILYDIKNRESNNSAIWGQISRPKFLTSIYVFGFNLSYIEYLQYVYSESCSMAICLDNYDFKYKWFLVSGKTCL